MNLTGPTLTFVRRSESSDNLIRFCNFLWNFYKFEEPEGKYSLFEEIASDISCYGEAKYAVEEIFDDVKDWNNPRNQTRLKGLVHLAIHEG